MTVAYFLLTKCSLFYFCQFPGYSRLSLKSVLPSISFLPPNSINFIQFHQSDQPVSLICLSFSNLFAFSHSFMSSSNSLRTVKMSSNSFFPSPFSFISFPTFCPVHLIKFFCNSFADGRYRFLQSVMRKKSYGTCEKVID